MSNITFKVELDNYRKKDGTSNIQIRLTEHRRLKRITVGVAILPEHWNPEKQEVRRGNSQYRQINQLIKAKILELEQLYLDASVKNKAISSASLVAKVKKEILGDSFLAFADERIKEMPSPATRKAQTSVIKKLREYLGSRDLSFPELDYQFLLKYERHLKRIGNGVNTIHANMKNIKAMYNEALNSNLFVPEGASPWNTYKPKKAKSKRNKLSEEQIVKIEKLDIKPGINEWHSRNIFLMSFYLQGMRTADILQLKWNNINGNRVEYVAGKTGKFRSKKIIDRAELILKLYRYSGLRPDDYVFPFLKSRDSKKCSPDEWLGIISSANAIINGHLKTIAGKLEINNLSMHVARHSFADIANKKTKNVYAVSDALDHSSVSVTVDYLNAATRSENDDVVDTVFG